MFEQPQQYVGRDVVGNIPDHYDPFRGFIFRPCGPRARSEHSIEIDGQNIAFNNLHITCLSELHTELRREHAVQLHRDQAACSFRQHSRKHALARTDFENRPVGNITQGVHDLHSRAFVRQKVLTQFGFLLFGGALEMTLGTLTLFLFGD